MRLGILGTLLAVDDAGREIRVTASRHRTLLAALLARANRTVSVDELTEMVWDRAPPGAAARTLRSYMTRLRDAVGPGVAARILTRDPGYLFQVAEDELDALRFEALCRKAGVALRAAAWIEASTAAVQATELWRGTPLLDVPSQALREAFVPRLEQLHLQALEDRIEASLHLHEHDRLVPELRELNVQHPVRERFRAQLMLALYQSGRQAEALEVYREARRVLVEELGIEPGPQLRAVHTMILAGDAAPTARFAGQPSREIPVAAVLPRQLPAAAGHFTGRVDELRALSSLSDRVGSSGGTVVISAIGGTAGVGKTALALHFAHRVADRFPDGQLYANLLGFDPSGSPPVQASSVVRRFLDTLVVPAARIPINPQAQLDLYRSLLADKRVLIVLDNARDAGQVRPLLPGAAGCLVLVTSRNRLTGLIALDGAIPLTLDLLTHGEARELLACRLGPGRVAVEEYAAGELIDLCARLPLALNIAAARAATHPDTPLDTFADQLRDAHCRLDLLAVGENTADLRAVFSWSFQTLTAQAARMFRLLGVHPGPDIGIAAAASLAAIDVGQARCILAELSDSHLLTETLPGRYGFHDLLRAYAGEQADIHDSVQARHSAMHRMLDHYLHTAHGATRVLFPARDPLALPALQPGTVPEHFADDQQALTWFDTERPVLLAATTLATAMRFDAHAWQIPSVMAVYFERRGHWHDYAATQTTALSAAVNADDPAAQANAHCLLGRACSRSGSHQDAHAHLQDALGLYRKLGDRVGQAHTHHSLGWMFGRQDRHLEALQHAQQALHLYRAADHRTGQARALNTVGWYRSLLGMHQQALAYCQQALDLHRELGNHDGQADAWDSLGHAHYHLGHFSDAGTCYGNALDLFRKLGDRHQQADILDRLGDTHYKTGDTTAAHGAWQQALAILEDLQHPDAEPVRDKLHKEGARD